VTRRRPPPPEFGCEGSRTASRSRGRLYGTGQVSTVASPAGDRPAD
jgi:hypothetical protein